MLQCTAMQMFGRRVLTTAVSNDYTQPFKDKFWLQHTIQVQTAEGPADTKACIRDFDDSLRKALHDKHKLVKARVTVLSIIGQGSAT